MADRTRSAWQRNPDARAEAQLDRYDVITDVMLQKWRAAEIARADAVWEKIVPLLPSDAASAWLDNLATCINSGATWKSDFPVSAAQAQWPETDPSVKFTVRSDTTITFGATPAQQKRAQLYADVVALQNIGVRQTAIARQLGISQPTVSLWLRKGIK